MGQTTLSVRMDAEVKSRLDALCADVGMTVSTAVNLFAKAFIRQRRIPFEVAASDSFLAGENLRHLRRGARQIREGRTVGKTMSELEGMENG